MDILAGVAAIAAVVAATIAWVVWRAVHRMATEPPKASADPVLADSLARIHETLGRLPTVVRDEVERLRTSVLGDLAQMRAESVAAADRSATAQEAGAEKLAQAFEVLRTRLADDLALARTEQREGLQGSRQAQADALAKARTEQAAALQMSRRALDERFESLVAQLHAGQETSRQVLGESLQQIRTSNEDKLEQMRATVQEKLDATLGERLDASFKRVSDHLESVHKGLGEMQTLAAGVGSLQRTLTNVKTRGVWAELQLESLLSDILTPEQFERQCRVQPDSLEMADFAIKMPGGEDGAPVRLAIDAKFPMDGYERLCEAWETGDVDQVKLAAKHLEDRVRAEAASIGRKYVAPPFTTDFAVLYLPTEGLFAEIARKPDLMHELRARHRVIIAGPTTLTALLGSLSMGFRTLAIAKRSSEAWKVLGQVKSEFEKSGAVWEKVVNQLETTKRTANAAGTRHRAVVRTLRKVESVPADERILAELCADVELEPSGPPQSGD